MIPPPPDFESHVLDRLALALLALGLDTFLLARGGGRAAPGKAAAGGSEGVAVSEPDDQADAGDVRPWERPGAVRRDVAVHRAELLGWLANVSLACSVAALALSVPIVVAVPLAVAACSMASWDLGRMRQGRLDPRGRAATLAAYDRAVKALLLGTLAPVLWLLLWCGCVNGLYPFRVFFMPWTPQPTTVKEQPPARAGLASPPQHAGKARVLPGLSGMAGLTARRAPVPAAPGFPLLARQPRAQGRHEIVVRQLVVALPTRQALLPLRGTQKP